MDLKCCLMILKVCLMFLEYWLMDLKCVLMTLKYCLMSLKCFFNDLSSSLINFVRSRDPVGEKTTKIGTYKGGRRP